MRLDAAAAAAGLDSLELLHALEVIVAVDGHGVDQLLADQLADALGALLAVLLGLLHSHDLPVLEGDQGADLAPVRSGLVKLFVQFELQLHRLERGGGFDVPSIALLENVTN